MFATDGKLRRGLKIMVSITAIAILGLAGLLVWRDMPVHIKVTSITKVLIPEADEFDKWQCARFNLTPGKFSDYFAIAHRLTESEEDDYGYGGCYYETKIEGRTYRIWQGGTAQIEDRNGMKFYADSSRKTTEPR